MSALSRILAVWTGPENFLLTRGIIMKMLSGVTRKLKDVALFIVRNIVRLLVVVPWTRQLLNKSYLKLSPEERQKFHGRFSRIFRNSVLKGRDGVWKIVFAGKEFQMPLRRELFWLDWDSAVSIIGNDIEVKETYNAILDSSERPELFIDVGANYGTHSLLFLVNGVETISCEPNSVCREHFKKTCEFNGIEPHIEAVALGERSGEIELMYPERDTWNGSTNKEVIEKLAKSEKLISEKVSQKPLDDFVSIMKNKKTLIKIDTEGNELSVLQGAKKVLSEIKPKIVFECWGDDDRSKIFSFFKMNNYAIFSLPWNSETDLPPLTDRQFSVSRSINFLASPI